MKVIQTGFNYSQDGQGNRLVIHLQGCNMHCPWCANPEGMDLSGCLVTDDKWLEDWICPRGAISEKKLDRNICTSCMDRVCLMHRNLGIRLSYTEYTIDELFEMIEESRKMFFDGGGVTFSGGECTLQFDELAELLQHLTRKGIHTAIETNASHPQLPTIFPYIGQLIMDCKQTDPVLHRKWIQTDNAVTLENIRRASQEHPDVLVRVPLIGGVNNSPMDIQNFTSFFRSVASPCLSVEILKYHEYGKKKWAECGKEYTMTDSAKVTQEEILAFRKKLEEAGARTVET